MIGLGCLGLGFIFLIIWSLVWMVAAQVILLKYLKKIKPNYLHVFQVTEKQKTIISRPNPLLFKRVWIILLQGDWWCESRLKLFVKTAQNTEENWKFSIDYFVSYYPICRKWNKTWISMHILYCKSTRVHD